MPLQSFYACSLLHGLHPRQAHINIVILLACLLHSTVLAQQISWQDSQPCGSCIVCIASGFLPTFQLLVVGAVEIPEQLSVLLMVTA